MWVTGTVLHPEEQPGILYGTACNSWNMRKAAVCAALFLFVAGMASGLTLDKGAYVGVECTWTADRDTVAAEEAFGDWQSMYYGDRLQTAPDVGDDADAFRQVVDDAFFDALQEYCEEDVSELRDGFYTDSIDDWEPQYTDMRRNLLVFEPVKPVNGDGWLHECTYRNTVQGDDWQVSHTAVRDHCAYGIGIAPGMQWQVPTPQFSLTTFLTGIATQPQTAALPYYAAILILLGGTAGLYRMRERLELYDRMYPTIPTVAATVLSAAVLWLLHPLLMLYMHAIPLPDRLIILIHGIAARPLISGVISYLGVVVAVQAWHRWRDRDG